MWSLHSNSITCYIPPTLRLFLPNGLQTYHYFFFEGCACDILLGYTFLPMPSFHVDFSATSPIAPSLSLLVTSQSVQVHRHHVPPVCAVKSGECSYIYGSEFVSGLFFRFGVDQPLHNVLSLIFCSQIEVMTICFMISSSAVFLKILLSVVLFSRHCSHLEPWFLVPVIPSSFA
jgi:hypothetical protein